MQAHWAVAGPRRSWTVPASKIYHGIPQGRDSRVSRQNSCLSAQARLSRRRDTWRAVEETEDETGFGR